MTNHSAGQSENEIILPHACSQCESITLPGEPEKIYLDYRRPCHDPTQLRYRRFFSKNFSRLNLSMRDVERMSKEGCAFASYLLKALGNLLSTEVDWRFIELFTEVRLYWGIKFVLHAIVCLENMASSDEDLDEKRLRRYAYASISRDHPKPEVNYTATAFEACKFDRKIPCTKPMVRNPLSENTVARITSWLRECDVSSQGTHRLCSIKEKAFVPSRLIEVLPVANGLQLRLITGKQIGTTRYSALSYCWGEKQEKQLTRNNLRSYQSRIAWEDLPKTLKDAAIATHRMGLRYLWIDSMCIIQSDQDDKAREIRRMAQVYTHAHFTIVDMRGSSASDGFLHDRTLPSGTCALLYEGTEGLNTRGTLLYNDFGSSEDRMVLKSRGWAMQEYVLSRRLIVFGTWSTYWMCRTKRKKTLDGWYHFYFYSGEPFEIASGRVNTPGTDFESLPETFDLLDFILFYSMNQILRHDQPLDIPIWKAWEVLIVEYSNRKFSVPQDRTIALSALAEKFAPIIPSSRRYIAGIWEHYLLEGLLWTKDYRDLHERPLGYRAPSWSWQSLDIKIRHEIFSSKFLCTVLSVKYTLADPDAPFGAVASASLELKGPSLSIWWRYNRSEGGSYEDDRLELGSIDADEIQCVQFKLDAGLDARERSSAWRELVFVAIETSENDTRILGLSLTQVEGAAGSSTFRRIGRFRIDPLDDRGRELPHIKDWPERVVHII